MPLYTYRCGCGIVWDAIARPRESSRACACGAVAKRDSVYHVTQSSGVAPIGDFYFEGSMKDAHDEAMGSKEEFYRGMAEEEANGFTLS